MDAPLTAPGRPTLPARPIRVMIVDDSAVVRGLVARWIEEESGLEVVARHANGGLAVEDVARSAPDIVLLDIEMPVMDGIAFLVALRKEQGGNVPKVIFCTTENDVEHITRAITAGANAVSYTHLTLPTTPYV